MGNVNVNGGPGLKRLIEVSIILLLPRLVTRALSAEARDFSISALGIFISALSRNVSALSDLGLKRGKKQNSKKIWSKKFYKKTKILEKKNSRQLRGRGF